MKAADQPAHLNQNEVRERADPSIADRVSLPDRLHHIGRRGALELKSPGDLRIAFERAVGDRLFHDAENVEFVGIAHQMRKPSDTRGNRNRHRAPVVQCHGGQHQIAFCGGQVIQPALLPDDPHAVRGMIDRPRILKRPERFELLVATGVVQQCAGLAQHARRLIPRLARHDAPRVPHHALRVLELEAQHVRQRAVGFTKRVYVGAILTGQME